MQKVAGTIDRKFSVAPMMDWTDRHCRYLMRLISHHALLYTEMVTTGALLHGDKQLHLDYNPEEHPLALQLGGSVPTELAQCSKLGEQWGYDEVNLNCGCPSDRVQSGQFGASLMAEPQVVADCLKAMADACAIPVTLKCRIGIDAMDSYEQFRDFVGVVTKDTGCHTVIVHARKAWLNGLSPKENREIPPLHYDYAYHLKQELVDLEIIINGGITTLDQCSEHLQQVDGIMMGRAAYQNPSVMMEVDHRFYDKNAEVTTHTKVCEAFVGYVESQLQQGTRLHHMTRHLLGLYQGVPGARKFRRYLSENAYREDAGIEVLRHAMDLID